VYKVACLIHIMGPGTEYETQVCAALDRLNAENLLAIVQLHSRVVHDNLSRTRANLGDAHILQ